MRRALALIASVAVPLSAQDPEAEAAKVREAVAVAAKLVVAAQERYVETRPAPGRLRRDAEKAAWARCIRRMPVAASDAFFPFADGPQLLIDAGVKCIVHPGGSKRDQETIDLCAQRDITLFHTGTRQFRH